MIYRLLLISFFMVPVLLWGPTGAHAEKSVLRQIESVFIDVASRVKPTVVSIRAESRLRIPTPEGKEEEKEKRPSPHPNVPRFSSGSGFIIDGEGYILTNNHVVENANRLRVRLADNSTYWARVIGTDRYTDLAVIKIDPRGTLPVAKLGNSESVKVGQWAIAVGDPFGITRTMTVGVVSGLGRSGVGVARYEFFIQTDAAINRGNSGGPLVNIDGEVIGINTAIPAPGSGIGFAIPVNMARDVVKYLRRMGNFPRGYLGVTIQPVGNDMAHLLGLNNAEGALVGSLLKDGPAMEAGVEPGDVIVGINGKKVTDTSHLQRLVGWTPPGKDVSLDIVRYGRPKSLTVKLTQLPDATGGKKKPSPPVSQKTPVKQSYGMDIESLTPELMKKNQLTTAGGVIIRDVDSGSRAFRDGLRAGMVIREFTFRAPGDRTAPVRLAIKNLNDFESTLSKIPPGANVLARIARGSVRGERTFFFVLRSIRSQ
jgi:Do/DeqQ family serine protease